MKKLIINADDFGLSRSVNRGIIFGFQKGIITSTTLLSNMPGFDDAVRLALKNPRLGVGVHLNIYRGKPLSPPHTIPSLVNREGNFLASSALVKRICFRKIRSSEIERELKVQIQKVKEAGIKITHLDSEKHFHAFPGVAPVVAKLASYFNIKRVRVPCEKWNSWRLGDLVSPQWYKMQYLALNSGKLIKELENKDIIYVDNFYGILYSKRLTLKSFLNLLENVRDGYSELMVHPGFVDQELIAISKKLNYFLISSRQKELKILTHPLVYKRIKAFKIKLINYRDLK